ncbi:STY4851/ECs_5259 family protein [Burkholderia vietnamiensis]|uniref:STY4851/ECs_5259 family protein n=1 Tax=Burkholderia vietnamiensis TaxID=60552 RepID=UPI00158FDBEB|nr:STY4851/ECs_5259 family protein [Burkholderia vietnamiensis]
MKGHQITAFTDWKRSLLSSRQLARPDGRRLYQYRLSKEEYCDLHTLLRTWCEKLSHLSFTKIRRIPGFACLFVLYASEWWRREYNGSHWTWDPILQSIDPNSDPWLPQERSECVNAGLQDWGVTSQINGGLRYLGAVAIEGGLPMRLLAEARGKIGQLLGQVLRLAGDTRVTPQELLTWVNSLQKNLPKSYRHEIVYTLLADVAWIVLCLKDEAKLTSSQNALSKLDQEIRGWRERFPLPIDDAHSQGLIEQLIRDAADIRTEKHTFCFPVERELVIAGDANWSLRSVILVPETILVTQLAKLLGETPENMPRAGELSLTAEGKRTTTTIRRLAGQERYHIERSPWGYSGSAATSEHLLHLQAPDGRLWSNVAPKGSMLDNELPWVFSADEVDSHRFLRQGSGSINATEGLVALPSGWNIRAINDATVTDCGQLNVDDRHIVRIRGTVEACCGEEFICRIRTGQAGASGDSYEWRGQREWLDFQSPSVAFKGLPKLYRVNPDGNIQKAEGEIGWSMASNIEHAKLQPIGPVTVRYPANGEIKQRARIVVLPADARIAMRSHSPTAGEVRLLGWGALNARVMTDFVQYETRREPGTLIVSIQTPQGQRAPERVQLEVRWPNTTTAARFTIPFPGQGTRAFDGQGNELQSGSMLSSAQLAGVRMLVNNAGSNTRVQMEIKSKDFKQARHVELRSLPGAMSLEVRLQDYAMDIQHQLSTDDGPDARAWVEVRVSGCDAYRLEITRYAAKLEKNGPYIGLNALVNAKLLPEQIDSLPVMALRLEQPGEEALRLNPATSHDVPTGMWEFSPENREPGSWLIYPGQNAILPFRPTLWFVPGELTSNSDLAHAINIGDDEARTIALDRIIGEIGIDYLHHGWNEIEQLVSQIGHLSLATLDLWRRFAKSPMGMAALAMRLSQFPTNFLVRFDQELPFAWEIIPFSAWRNAIGNLKAQCYEVYGDEIGKVIFQTQHLNRVQQITASHGGLMFMLGMASADFLLESKMQSRVLPSLGMQAQQHLFGGEGSSVMALRRMHANDTWPTGLGRIISEAKRVSTIAAMLYPENADFATTAINAPLLVATQAATNQSDSWFRDPKSIHELRAARAFDPEWFDDAYNQTFARCIANGLLHN